MVELEGVPELVDPVLVAAFEGWNDAGDAATGAVEHMETAFSAEPVAALDPEDYYDFQVSRPMVAVDESGVRRLEWPTTRVGLARSAGGRRDLVLVRGIEPNMRWRSFCGEILELCSQLRVEAVVSLGALLADVPHTRPVPVTGTSSDPGLGRSLGLEPSRYEGPTQRSVHLDGGPHWNGVGETVTHGRGVLHVLAELLELLPARVRGAGPALDPDLGEARTRPLEAEERPQICITSGDVFSPAAWR